MASGAGPEKATLIPQQGRSLPAATLPWARADFAWLAGLCLATYAVYLPVLGFDFVFDDRPLHSPQPFTALLALRPPVFYRALGGLPPSAFTRNVLPPVFIIMAVGPAQALELEPDGLAPVHADAPRAGGAQRVYAGAGNSLPPVRRGGGGPGVCPAPGARGERGMDYGFA